METLKEILATPNPGVILRTMFQNGTLKNLEPSLVALRMKIPAGYHHKDNFEHSIRVLENTIAQENNGVNLTLRTAALFHDIGKPRTRRFIGKNTTTFENHEVVGAKMVKPILTRHGYHKEEINTISTLIRLHMRSHNYDTSGWTDSAVRRLLADAGDLFPELVILFYSDVTSRVEKTQQKVKNSLDALVLKARKVAEADARAKLRPAVNGNDLMEKYGLTPGKTLGTIMRFLNQDENIHLTKTEALALVETKFGLK